jgi:3-oxoacyl-[acyl-carrier protein] reductase
VIVTGAAGGIGRAIIAALAAADCRVAACDADGAGAGAVAGATTSAEFDVRDRAAVRQRVVGAVTALGGCDAVVANAGVVDTIHRAERFSEDDWRLDLETNLYGAFNVVQATFEELASAGDGRVVLISSVGAELGIPGQVAYGASKAGLVGMARTLAAEWAPRGVR